MYRAGFTAVAAASLVTSFLCLPAEPAALGEKFSLHVGESASIDGAGLALTFEDVKNDSRCPRDVQCVRAGEATLVFAVRTKGGDTTRLTFEVPPQGSAKRRFHEYDIEIVELEPQTESRRRIDRDDYVAKVSVVEVDRKD